MKTVTLLTTTAVLVFGLNGCGGGANMDPNVSASGDVIASRTDMETMQFACKNYLGERFKELPMAAFSVRPGYGGNGRYTIPVSINWDDPRVEETGNCIIENGIVRNYKGNY